MSPSAVSGSLKLFSIIASSSLSKALRFTSFTGGIIRPSWKRFLAFGLRLPKTGPPTSTICALFTTYATILSSIYTGAIRVTSFMCVPEIYGSFVISISPSSSIIFLSLSQRIILFIPILNDPRCTGICSA